MLAFFHLALEGGDLGNSLTQKTFFFCPDKDDTLPGEF
jgi:hypothetical protein